MIEYRKVGGIAGIEEVLRIEDDGSVRYRRSLSGTPQFDIEARLEPSQTDDLETLAAQGDILGVGAEDEVKERPFDALSSTLTYRSGDGERTIPLGSPERLPRSIRTLVSRLEEIGRELQPRLEQD